MLVPLLIKNTFRSGFTTEIFKEVQCTEYRVQAKQNWTILEKLGLFVCVLLKTSFFSALLLFNFLFFVYILSESMCTVWTPLPLGTKVSWDELAEFLSMSMGWVALSVLDIVSIMKI